MILIISVLVFFLCYAWTKINYSHWTKKGVKGPEPLPIVGNFGTVVTLSESVNQLVKRSYNEYGNEKAIGIFQGSQPVLILRDPEMIKQVLTKDFHVFQDRSQPKSGSAAENNLFSAEDEVWRILRQQLTPIFTSRKLKSMIPLIQKCVDNYITYIDSLLEHSVEQEIRDMVSKYTLEVIGSCAFGVEMEAFTNKKNIYVDIANQIFSPSLKIRLGAILNIIIPNLAKFVDKYLIRIKNANDLHIFFSKLVRKIVKEREGKPKVRKDFMDLMIELKEKGRIERREQDKISTLEFNDDIIAAQALVFYAAGFDTSAAAMCFLIHELAYNQDIQEKLFKEVSKVTGKNSGHITYEDVNVMSYLEMCFEETLRRYPIVGSLKRKASSNYEFSGENLRVDKGTPVFIPISGLHMDPKYFKNPEIFDPERFSTENKSRIPQFVYMPFGEGPRHCIGLRFAKVQSMLAMSAFLRIYKVEPSRKTERNLKFSSKGITLTAASGIWVKITKR